MVQTLTLLNLTVVLERTFFCSLTWIAFEKLRSCALLVTCKQDQQLQKAILTDPVFTLLLQTKSAKPLHYLQQI